MKARLKSAVLFLTSFIVIVLLLEGMGQLAITYLESTKVSGTFGEELLDHNEPLVGFGLKKNLNKRFGHWRVRTTKLGFRGDEFPVKKPNDEIRLFILGGSTVFGWGANSGTTIPDMLSQLIQEHLESHPTQKKVRVINAGVPWYASWHETSHLIFKVMPLEPDWIITLNGLNDVAQGILPNWNPIYLGHQDLPTTIAKQKKFSKRNIFSEFLRLSPTYRYFHARVTAREQIKTGVYQPEVWDQYQNYMQWTQSLTNAEGIRFSVFLQPTIAVEYTPNEQEIRDNASTLRDPTFAATFRKVYLEGVRRFEGNSKFRFHSLHALFKNSDSEKEKSYIDGLHYSGAANWKIARRIFELEVRPHLMELTKKEIALK